MYVGIGIILAFTIASVLIPVNCPYTKIIMGLSFGVALSLVVMAGAELFTGNNMVMSVATLNNEVCLKDTIKIWSFSFLGNFLGALILALLFCYSGLVKADLANVIVQAASVKITLPALSLLIRGLLCNMLVCLAVWCTIRMNSETGKLIMILWCLFAFVTSGFEHSVANMTLILIGCIITKGSIITLTGLFYNLLFVTIGNIIGGSLMVGFTYNIIAKKQSV